MDLRKQILAPEFVVPIEEASRFPLQITNKNNTVPLWLDMLYRMGTKYGAKKS